MKDGWKSRLILEYGVSGWGFDDKSVLEKSTMITGCLLQFFPKPSGRKFAVQPGNDCQWAEGFFEGASIQELTRLIDRKITLISSAGNRKREKEIKTEQHLRKQMDALRGGMEKIREELVDVKQENKSL